MHTLSSSVWELLRNTFRRLDRAPVGAAYKRGFSSPNSLKSVETIQWKRQGLNMRIQAFDEREKPKRKKKKNF
jgi:hypothetical protein